MAAAPASPSLSAQVSGSIGSNFANFSLHEDRDRVEISGWVGQSSVYVHQDLGQDSSRLSGTLSHRSRIYPVSLWVNGPQGSRSISGFVGDLSVHLQESGGSGMARLTGWIGSRFVNLWQQNSQGWLSLDGQVGDPGSGRVWLQGRQSPLQPPVHYEGLIPALALTDPVGLAAPNPPRAT
jgi:hypothetical protein